MPNTLPDSVHISPVEWLRALYSLQRVDLRERDHYQQLLRDIENAFCILPSSLTPESVAPYVRSQGAKAAKPLVHVDTTVTAKGNLVVRWYPRGHYEISKSDASRVVNETDFTPGALLLLDALHPQQRPINEVLFLRDFERIPCRSEKLLSPFEHCLLGLTTSLAHEYTMSLQAHFDVSVGARIEPIFVKGRAHGWKSIGEPRTVVFNFDGRGGWESQIIPEQTS